MSADRRVKRRERMCRMRHSDRTAAGGTGFGLDDEREYNVMPFWSGE